MTNEEIQKLLDKATAYLETGYASIDAAEASINAAHTAIGAAMVSIKDAHDALNPTEPPPTEPPPTTPPTGTLPRFGGAPGFGIISRAQTNPATITTELDKWADIGCQILRYDLLDRADYIAVFDKILAACEQRKIKTILCARGTSGPFGATAAGSLGTRLAQKYGTRILVYEYVNEPNLGSTQGASRYSAAQYGPELAAFYAAVKKEGDYLVANGGLGIWAGSGASYPPVWWPNALNNGARDHYDCGNGHAYEDVAAGQWTAITSLDFQNKPLLITEAGSRPANQAAQVQKIMTDKRAATVCYYTMMPDNLNWHLYGNPGYGVYKSLPKT